MSMIFSDDDYESQLEEYMNDSSMAINSDTKEAIFRQYWEETHNPKRSVDANKEKR